MSSLSLAPFGISSWCNGISSKCWVAADSAVTQPTDWERDHSDLSTRSPQRSRSSAAVQRRFPGGWGGGGVGESDVDSLGTVAGLFAGGDEEWAVEFH